MHVLMLICHLKSSFSKRGQFLMELRHEFETVQSNLISSDPSPTLNTCLNELPCKELLCTCQATMEQQTVFAGTVIKNMITYQKSV